MDENEFESLAITHVKTGMGEMPSPGFGTFQLKGKECRKAVESALDLGYRHLDTAEMYENEKEVGAALTHSGVDRGDVFVTTKIWRDHLDAAHLQAAFADCLRRLDTEYVDLLLIHWPNEDIPLQETLRKMNEFADAGHARLIGVSNFPSAMLEDAVALSDHPIFCNQVEYHPFLDQSTLLETCRKNDVILTAYSPLAQGKALENDTLRDIGSGYGKNAGQVALRWLMQQDRVVPIPRSANPNHIRDNLDVLDFSLTEEEMKTITALTGDGRIISPGFAPAWDD